MKKILLFFVAFTCTLFVSAHDVEIDGIYYNLISKERIAEIMFVDAKLSDETPVNSPQMADEGARVKKYIEAGRIVILSSGKRYGIDGKSIVN